MHFNIEGYFSLLLNQKFFKNETSYYFKIFFFYDARDDLKAYLYLESEIFSG